MMAPADATHSTAEPRRSSFGEYVKFALVIVLIAAVAAILTRYRYGVLDPFGLMRFFMGGFFVVFALFQLVGYRSFVMMFPSYDPLAARLRWYAYAFPFIEIGLGLWYLFDVAPVVRDVVTAYIMLTGAWGVWQHLRAERKRGGGHQMHCACLGNVIKLPLSQLTFAEDVVMGGMALVALVRVSNVTVPFL